MIFKKPDTATTNSGTLNGIQKEIACECWFTSKGRTKPRLIKILDEQGMIHIIEKIEVIFSEEKNYSGIPTVEHVCKIYYGNLECFVKLIYAKDTCKWTIIFL
ncbi:MAG: hypothetical protein MJ113_00840 [Lachnospiraceae bacterium]|nr:hypothetical protein [Lachnospiraceae bacterium]